MQSQDPQQIIGKLVAQIPMLRTTVAVHNGVERRILMRASGGFGDIMCSEPSFRYAFKKFKDCEFFLATETPGLFKHLPFKRVFDLNDEFPNYNNFFVFDTVENQSEEKLACHFISHMLTNCVDYPSIRAFRLQLPVEDRIIQLSSDKPDLPNEVMEQVIGGLLIHPGAHWQTKTFPEPFWSTEIQSARRRLAHLGRKPIIIGGKADDNRGTVIVDTEGCIDLRNKTTIPELVWLCQNAKVILTNDSMPLHAGASGNAWIGYVATAKHPDMITHWRLNEYRCPTWQWREVNFGRGGVWDLVDYCPNKLQEVSSEYVDPMILKTWLPEPEEMATWAMEMMK